MTSISQCAFDGLQGLIKAEGKQRFGEEYARWSKQPHTFEMDGHAPVRELWYRASLAWQEVACLDLISLQYLEIITFVSQLHLGNQES